MDDVGIVVTNPETDVCIAPFKFKQYEQLLLCLRLPEELVKKIERGSADLSLVLDAFQEEQKESPKIYYDWGGMCIVFYGFERGNEFLKQILKNASDFFCKKWVYPEVEGESCKFKIYSGILNEFY